MPVNEEFAWIQLHFGLSGIERWRALQNHRRVRVPAQVVHESNELEPKQINHIQQDDVQVDARA